MARASFGGASDYSDLFAQVYGSSTGTGSGNPDIAEANRLQYQFDSNQISADVYAAGLEAIAAQYANGVNDQKYYQYMDEAARARTRTSALSKQNEAEVKANQAATDSDMQSQWQAGVISNDEWLAYVASRAASAGDAKEQAKWEGYHRKFAEQIGDSTAEYAYEMGGSLNDLITYYQTKITGKEPGAQDTQKDQLRLNDLVDTRAGQNVAEGAQKIIDLIDEGKATYEDLLRFEKESLAAARPNSAIAGQLKSEIEKVEDTIRQNKSDAILGKAEYDFKTKKLTGAAYAKIIEAEADQYKTSDPGKYYQFLQTANDYRTKSPGLYGAGSAGDAAKAKAAKTLDTNQATRDYGYFYAKAAESGLKSVVGPDGTQVSLTPSLLAAWDKKVVASYDSDASVYRAKGDKSAAAEAATNKMNFINQFVVAHNTMPVAERDLAVATARQTQLDLYEGSAGLNAAGKYTPQGYSDPLIANTTFGTWLSQDARAIYGAANTTTPIGGRDAHEGVTGAPKTGMQTVDPAYIAQQQATNAALRVANTPGVTPDQLEQAAVALGTAYGGTVPTYLQRLFDAMGQNSENLAGSQSGSRVLVANIDGYLQWVDAAPRSIDSYGPTGRVAGSALRPAMEQAGFDPKGNTKVVDVIVDDHGVPKHVKAVATEAYSDLQVWTVGSKKLTISGGKGGDTTLLPGHILTHDELARLDKTEPGWRDFAGEESAGSYYYKDFAPDGRYYTVTIKGATDAQGKAIAPVTWTQDPGTNQWVRGDGLQLKNVSRETDGTVLVTQSGPQIDFLPDSGFAVPYAGRNLRGAQSVLNSDGTIDTSELKGRDLNGRIVPSPVHDPGTSFFNPARADHRATPGRDGEDPILALERDRRKAAAAFRREEIMTANRPEIGDLTPPVSKNVFAGVQDFGRAIGLTFGGSTRDGPTTARATPAFTSTTYTGAQFGPSYSPAAYSGPTLPPIVIPSLTGSRYTPTGPPPVAPKVTVPFDDAYSVAPKAPLAYKAPLPIVRRPGGALVY